ncbi:MAG TPA: hypothetical protein VIL74_24235 [Pyrinomonadaceae bacterium]|jgi:hypothetical protein
MANALINGKFKGIASLFNKGSKIDKRVFGERVGFLQKIFGCGHQDLSRPFSNGKFGYRVCLNCGARKQFNTETLETYGSFYFAPVEKPDLKIGV